MHLKTTNVNEAFYLLVNGIHIGEVPTKRTTSRNGDVLQIEEPVIITYERPRERVLLSPERDCNPFFHLFEAIWMLAGSNKLAPVAFFTPGMKNYSDDGITLNGAYGYRWRVALGDYINQIPALDQLDMLVGHLTEFSNSRRAVLQMWDVERDLMKAGVPCRAGHTPEQAHINKDCLNNRDTGHPQFDAEQGGCAICDGTGITVASKDVCCNLSVCFSLRQGMAEAEYSAKPYLDMTVFNRSNDLILGCLGANVVHFSFLQEYMACALGVEVGIYNQISNNLHVYCNNWEPEKWLNGSEHANCYPNLYDGPLFKDREQFDRECQNLVNVFDNPKPADAEEYRYIGGYLAGMQLKERFLLQVVRPMCIAFCYHKLRYYDSAKFWLGMVAAPDWQRVGTEWVQRRQAKWLAKQGQV